MSFTANDYVVDAAELYSDIDGDRIDSDVWIRYLNASIRALVLVRPDAGAVTEPIQLVAGIKQTIPSNALRLLDISRNMGVDGVTAGQIVTPTSRKHLDFANILWPAGSGDTYIENYSYDRNTPSIFYVTPPVHATTAVYVEMSTSQLPTTITATGDTVGVNDIFFEPLVQYMLYKAYSTDDEGTEKETAEGHFEKFLQLLGIESRSAHNNGPEKKE